MLVLHLPVRSDKQWKKQMIFEMILRETMTISVSVKINTVITSLKMMYGT